MTPDCPNCEATRAELAAFRQHHISMLRLASPLLYPIDYDEAGALVDVERRLRKEATSTFAIPTNEKIVAESKMRLKNVVASVPIAEKMPTSLNDLKKGLVEEGEKRVENGERAARKAVKSMVGGVEQEAKKLAGSPLLSQMLGKASLPLLLTSVAGAAISGPLATISSYAAYLGPLTAGAGLIGLVATLRSNAERAVKERIAEAEKTVASLATTEKFVGAAAAKGQIRDFLSAGGWVEKTGSGERWRLCADCGKRHGPFRNHGD